MPSEVSCEITSLSSCQLTNRITQITQTYLSFEILQSHIQQPVFSRATASVPSLREIGGEYGLTCALIWQTLWQSIEQPSLSNDALLNVQVQQLCLAWAHAKRYSADVAFFAASPTLFCGLQAKWNHPDIQFALRYTTIQLQSDRFYQDTLARFFTCWAYLLGCVMYQLLQWNHQLTPYTLRESWPVDLHPDSPVSTPLQR